MKSFKNTQLGDVRTQAAEFEKVIYGLKESNSPNWKDRAHDFVERIRKLEYYVQPRSLGDFSNAINAAFDDLVTRSDIFHGLQNNNQVNIFPMTCITNFNEARKVFITGQNTAYLKYYNRVISFINEN